MRRTTIGTAVIAILLGVIVLTSGARPTSQARPQPSEVGADEPRPAPFEIGNLPNSPTFR